MKFFMPGNILTILFFFVLVFFRIDSNIADMDLWGYMAFGRLYWETGKFPYQDVFTYLPSLDPWVYHEWLTGVVCYAVYRIIGESGLILMRYGLALLTLLFIYRIARQRGASQTFSLIILFFIGGFLTRSYGSVIRAQAFTFLFFTITLYLLESYRDGSGLRYLLIFIPLNGVWCNLHGGFISGLGLIFLYMIGRAISGSAYRFHLFLLIALGFSTLINPYGLEYWNYTYRAITMARPEITEWASILKSYQMNWISFSEFMSIIVIILISIRWIQYFRWREITPIIVLFITLVLGMVHIRHLTFFLIVGGAYLAPLAQKYFADIQFNPRFERIRGFMAAKGVMICFLVFMIVLVLYLCPKSLSLEVPASPIPGKMYYYPVGAIEYIHKNNISGNILTEFEWGEYIIWNSDSRLRVGLDGRFETVYPGLIAQEYFDFYYGRDEKFMDKYPHHLALLKPGTEGLKFIKTRPDWQKLYSDSGSVLYIHHPNDTRKRKGSLSL
jgi:hypothetical protein